MNNKGKTDYIRRFVIEKNIFHLPSRTIARMIVEENSALFGKYNQRNIEKARNIIRRLRYSNPNRNKNASGYKEDDLLFAQMFRGINESDEREFKPFFIPDEVTRLGIINDVHIPFHNKKNLKAAIDYLKQKEINGLLLNGDILDCYQVSRFLKDRRKKRLAEEMDILREFIDNLNSELNCPIFYKLGNHEERIELLVIAETPELVNFVTFENVLSMAGQFNFDDYKLTIIKDKRIIKFTEHLTILHGHEYRTGIFNPVGVSRWLYNKAGVNSCCGHAHKSDSFTKRTVDQKTIGTWSIGCLSEMNPEYMPLNDWQSGFAYVRKTDDGYFKFSNLMIDNGKIL